MNYEGFFVYFSNQEIMVIYSGMMQAKNEFGVRGKLRVLCEGISLRCLRDVQVTAQKQTKMSSFPGARLPGI